MTVQVRQFISPHGETRQIAVEVPDDCKAGYEALKSKGCRLTAEVLMTGHVSQCIEHEDGDFDIEVHANEPAESNRILGHDSQIQGGGL